MQDYTFPQEKMASETEKALVEEEIKIQHSNMYEEEQESIPSDYEYDPLNTTQDIDTDSTISSLDQVELTKDGIYSINNAMPDDSQQVLGMFLNFLRDNKLSQTADKLIEELRNSKYNSCILVGRYCSAQSSPQMKTYETVKEVVSEEEYNDIVEVTNDIVQSVVSEFYNGHQLDTKHYNHRLTPTNSAKKVFSGQESPQSDRPESASLMKDLQEFAHMYGSDELPGEIEQQAPLSSDDLFESFEKKVEEELRELEEKQGKTNEEEKPKKSKKEAKEDEYASDSDEEGYQRLTDFSNVDDVCACIPSFIDEEAPAVQDRRNKWRPPTEYETIYLPIIRETFKTGFEETNEFKIEVDSIIAERYQVVEYLGSATFSRAVQCLDLRTNQHVCIKIIKNDKDFFDQSLDEIKLLRFINSMGEPDAFNVVKLYDFFYYKEHLFIVCELLRDNLYEFYVYNRESGDELYFNLPRLQKVTRQLLTGLQFVHSLNLIHCDLKPENILIKSYSKCQVKIIDFGSSCFKWDNLPLYAQSRTYRAPEVVIGSDYDEKIDVWSLGCILAELFTGKVLFYNHSIQTMLAKILGLCGPFKLHQLQRGRFVKDFFRKIAVNGNIEYVLFRYVDRDSGKTIPPSGVGAITADDNVYEELLIPDYNQDMREKLDNCQDDEFVDFITQCLQIDPNDRLSVDQALHHPWMTKKYED